MQVLSTALLPQLQVLTVGNFYTYLGMNNISAAGMTIMLKWKLMSQFKELSLGIFLFIQVTRLQ